MSQVPGIEPRLNHYLHGEWGYQAPPDFLDFWIKIQNCMRF